MTKSPLPFTPHHPSDNYFESALDRTFDPLERTKSEKSEHFFHLLPTLAGGGPADDISFQSSRRSTSAARLSTPRFS